MIPLHDENPVERQPFVTWALVIACIAVYFLWQPTPFATDTDDTAFYLERAAIPCELQEGRPLTIAELNASFGDPARGIPGDDDACGIDVGESPEPFPEKNVWLALLTSMFLHGDVLHLGGNLLFLWIFGNNIEDRLGHVRYLAFYLLSGVVASAAHIALNLGSAVPVVGASGAIAGVMGAYLVWFPQAKVRTLVIFVVFFTVVRVSAMWLLAFWFISQFFTSPNSGVAWAAHVGGFAFGALVAAVVRRSVMARRATWRRQYV